MENMDMANNPLYYAEHLYCGDKEITDLVIPSDVKHLNNSFKHFSGLKSVSLGNTIESISNEAFWGCVGINEIDFGNSISEIGALAFWGCTGITTIVIPNTVKSIGYSAFNGCTGLTKVVIGNGVNHILYGTFAECPELVDVYCYSTAVPSTENDVFKDSYIEYATLHVPSSSIEKYKSTEPWNGFKEIVGIEMPKHSLLYKVDGDVYKSYLFEEGATITPEPAPEKEGYTFSGWSEIPETMPAHDFTVTGVFIINKYKLSYTVDDEEYMSYEIEYGEAINPEAKPTKDGYTFSGWSEIPGTMPAHDVSVRGTFTINKYNLTYLVDGEVYKSYELDYGTGITSETISSKEGYTFSGWSDIPEVMPDHDVVVTGNFTVNKYQVEFMFDDEVVKVDSVDYGAVIPLPTSVNNERYTLLEWLDVPETMPAHDIIIYATVSDDIRSITDEVDYKIYNERGLRIPRLQIGLNIIKYSNGKIRKVIVK